ncbi:MAG: CoA transferase subunit A, partial [Bacteroidota bacterium]
IHVHRADAYGNAQIDGISVADWDLARATKHLILTTEHLVDTEEIRRTPERTQIPYWLVDAVCHVPYGSYPGNMPYEYYFDEDHLTEWFQAEKDETSLAAFLEKYIYGTEDFAEYLALKGGEGRMAELRALEPLHRGSEEAWQLVTA